jgi:hypothetical protein
MAKSYRSRHKLGTYPTRAFRIPQWASVEIDHHAERHTAGNKSLALEFIISDWAATKRIKQKYGKEIDALIRSLESD